MLSFVRNPSTFEGFYAWYQFFLFAVLFVFFAAYTRSQPVLWKYRLLRAVAAIQATYLLVGFLSRRRPITAGFVNPDYFGSFLLVGFSICVSLALFRSNRAERLVGFLGAFFFYYGITQTWSRGATVAAFLIATLAIVRCARQASISLLATATILAVLLVVGAAISPSLVRKFTDVTGKTDPYNYMRPKIWGETLRLIGDNPFLGVGLGQFFHVSRRYAPALEGSLARYLKRPAIGHSEYLQHAGETGVPATVLLVTLLGYLIWSAFERAKTSSSDGRGIQEAAILTATGLTAHALVDNNWVVPVVAAGVVVFSLADVLPAADSTPNIVLTRTTKLLLGILLLVLYAHSTVIPSVGLWFNQSGYRAFAEGDLDTAEKNYRIAAAILPPHAPLLDETGMLYLSRYERTQDRRWLTTAEDFFGRAINANPNAEEPLRHMERAFILSLTGNADVDRAVHPQIAAIDRELLRVDPFNPFVRKNLAEALYRDGHPQEAEQELERALSYEPNYVAGYLTIARWESETGNIERANRYRQTASAILTKYQDFKSDEPYELMLLGRSDLGVIRSQ
jgi:O-antigen ligase